MDKINRPRDFFNKNVTDDAQKELVRLIFRGYRTPYDEIMQSDYKHSLGIDLFPNARRAKIDSYLIQLSGIFPDISTKIQTNLRRNSHHAVVYAGNVFFTASAVQNEYDLPRKAFFRQEYASMQTEFDYSSDENIFIIRNNTIQQQLKLYALILHGPEIGNDKWLPGFIKVAFPSKDCLTRMDDDIDLWKKYPNVVQELINEGTEVVEDNVMPTLIKQRKML